VTNDLKLRLYLTLIVIAMGFLYVTPFLVSSHWQGVRSELLANCLKDLPNVGFDFCWQQSTQKAALPFFEYLLPFVPSLLLLWLNWLLKPNLKLSNESYPRRVMTTLLWLGLLISAVGIYVPLSEVIARDATELHKIESRTFWGGPWLAAGWLISPLLFHHLLAPVSLVAQMRKGKIALWFVAATPVIAYTLYLFRAAIIDFAL